MQKLYIDCDGVILNTIDESYKILKEKKIESTEAIRKFYLSLDWEKFITDSGEILDAVSKIKKISESNLYEIKILTHVCSENESLAKTKYFKERLPKVEVIIVPKDIKKTEIVDPKGAILVDDFLGNLDDWYEKGGIPVKFSNSGKRCKYTKITDLEELLELKVKP